MFLYLYNLIGNLMNPAFGRASIMRTSFIQLDWTVSPARLDDKYSFLLRFGRVSVMRTSPIPTHERWDRKSEHHASTLARAIRHGWYGAAQVSFGAGAIGHRDRAKSNRYSFLLRPSNE